MRKIIWKYGELDKYLIMYVLLCIIRDTAIKAFICFNFFVFHLDILLQNTEQKKFSFHVISLLPYLLIFFSFLLQASSLHSTVTITFYLRNKNEANRKKCKTLMKLNVMNKSRRKRIRWDVYNVKNEWMIVFILVS